MDEDLDSLIIDSLVVLCLKSIWLIRVESRSLLGLAEGLGLINVLADGFSEKNADCANFCGILLAREESDDLFVGAGTDANADSLFKFIVS